jgi:hypothetical protein
LRGQIRSEDTLENAFRISERPGKRAQTTTPLGSEDGVKEDKKPVHGSDFEWNAPDSDNEMSPPQVTNIFVAEGEQEVKLPMGPIFSLRKMLWTFQRLYNLSPESIRRAQASSPNMNSILSLYAYFKLSSLSV